MFMHPAAKPALPDGQSRCLVPSFSSSRRCRRRWHGPPRRPPQAHEPLEPLAQAVQLGFQRLQPLGGLFQLVEDAALRPPDGRHQGVDVLAAGDLQLALHPPQVRADLLAEGETSVHALLLRFQKGGRAHQLLAPIAPDLHEIGTAFAKHFRRRRGARRRLPGLHGVGGHLHPHPRQVAEGIVRVAAHGAALRKMPAVVRTCRSSASDNSAARVHSCAPTVGVRPGCRKPGWPSP